MTEKLKIGLDTGFFVHLAAAKPEAKKIWLAAKSIKCTGVVSAISLFEIKRLALKGSFSDEFAQAILPAILESCHVEWIDKLEVIEKAAELSRGLGVAMADGLILAGFLLAECQEIVTTDAAWKRYKRKDIKIRLLQDKDEADQ